MKTLINPWLFLWYTFLSCLTGACTLYYLQHGKWIMTGIFMIFLVFYLYNALFRAGAVIIMDQEGIEKRILGMKRIRFSWEEVEEMGVAGMDLFRKKKNGGRKYLYFSKKAMTEDERFDMCLHWIPKDKIGVRYSPGWLEYAVRVGNREPVFYNTKRLVVESGK